MKKIWDTFEGKEISLYTLENEYLRLEISDFGATIRSLFVKPFQKDVVLGFDLLADYVRDENYLGATVGRNSNRIEKGMFTLNDKTYQLSINNGPNHLHGGIRGFNKRIFNVKHEDETSIVLKYLCKDNEENYPGNLDFALKVSLVANRVELEYRGICDQDSPFNPTQHSYFNLGDEHTIHNHTLQINSDNYSPIDRDGLSLYPPSVCGISMDFNQPVLLRDRLDQDDPQLVLGHGLDHHFNRKKHVEPFVKLQYQNRCLNIYTSSPGAHVYSGNYLNGARVGKEDFPNGYRSGICIETQFYPNNLNNDAMPKGILRAFEPMNLHTTWEFELIKEDEHE